MKTNKSKEYKSIYLKIILIFTKIMVIYIQCFILFLTNTEQYILEVNVNFILSDIAYIFMSLFISIFDLFSNFQYYHNIENTILTTKLIV